MSLVDTTELELVLAQQSAAIGRNTDAIQALIGLSGGLQDVTRYGVRGDGVTDDHAAIQKLFDSANRTLYFPGGRYRITQTLVIPARYGLRVLGGGLASGDLHRQGNNAVLVWAGPVDKPVVESLAFGPVLDGLNIDGNGTAAVGLLIDKRSDGPSVPTGKGYVPTMTITNCQTAVQVGGKHGTHNCDWLCWGFLNLDNCEVGYHLRNQQGIMHHITMLRPYNVRTIVRVDGGGNMNVENLGVVWGAKKILHFGHPGGSSNTASFRFNNVKQDNHLNNVIWFDQEGNDAGSVLFENSHLANDRLKTPMFQVEGYVDLTLRRVWGLPAGAIEAKSVTSPNGKVWSPNILVERCKCASTVKKPEDLFGTLTGACYTKTRDLLAGNGTPIE